MVVIAAAGALAVFQWAAFAAAPGTLPWGLALGGVPVGGLTAEQAAAQVQARYATPITLEYDGTALTLDPAAVGFQVDSSAMLAEAIPDRSSTPVRSTLPEFWRYLWRRPAERREDQVPLEASYSQEALRQFLTDIAARYDHPPQEAHPGLGDLMVHPGMPGQVMDVEASLEAVGAALIDPGDRSATLTVEEAPAPTATLDTLKLLIEQHTLLRPFAGLLSVTVVDLQTGEEMHVNVLDGELIRTEPDIAVAATSAVKPLIITEFYRERPEGLLPWEQVEIENIVVSSSNTSADNLMNWIGDGCWPCAFERITETGRQIGMPNTFVGGIYFAEGAYEIQLAPPGIATPANQMTDFTTHPDPFFQTTASDLARLYTAMYRCSKNDGGLQEVFPGEFSAESCQSMIDWLSQVADPLIIKKGVPDGTAVAHKHGFTDWLEGASGPDTVGDAGIVYTEGGDYVLAAFTYRAENPSWEEFTSVIAEVSRATWNYFNEQMTNDN